MKNMEEEVTYHFCDLRGELLEIEMDADLDELSREKSIPKQVRECDVFLFFFDPSSWDVPSDLHKHHKQELERAKSLIEYVLKQRQNKFLPIVFVITRLDEWESKIDVCSALDTWLKKISEIIQDLYNEVLEGHYPPDLVNLGQIHKNTSAEREGSVTEVIEQSNHLLIESEKYRRKDKGCIMKLVGVGIASVFVVALVSIAIFIFSDPTETGPNPPPPKSLDLSLILESLSEYPNTPANVVIDDAKNVNKWLHWLVKNKAAEGSKPRYQDAIKDISKIVVSQSLRKDENYELACELMEQYLKEIRDGSGISKALHDAQIAYWSTKEKNIVSDLGKKLTLLSQVEFNAEDCLGDFITMLAEQIGEIEQVKVFGTDKKDLVLDEIKILNKFFAFRLENKTYPMIFEILSAKRNDKEPKNISQIKFYSGSLKNNRSSYILRPKPNSHEYEGEVLGMSFRMQVGLGRSVVCGIREYSNEDWEKKASVTISTKRDDNFWAIGMPLMKVGLKNELEIKFKDNAYYSVVKVKFTNVQKVPQLLLDAVEYSELRAKR
jgi:hypothetical protein